MLGLSRSDPEAKSFAKMKPTALQGHLASDKPEHAVRALDPGAVVAAELHPVRRPWGLDTTTLPKTLLAAAEANLEAVDVAPTAEDQRPNV